jgi:hypothetical protein
MGVMAMTAEEKLEFKELEKKVEHIEDGLTKMQRKIDSIFSLVKGIAIGIGIGLVIFGVISVKDLISMAK